MSVFIPISKKGNDKECSNYHTSALILHTGKVILKILHARIHEPRTSRCTSWIVRTQRNRRSNCQHSLDHRESKRIPETSTSVSSTTLKPLTVWITINCGKFLKRREYLPYLSPEKPVCRSRSNSQNWTWDNGQQATDIEKWFKIGKGICRGCILSSCLFILYAKYIMRNAELDESQTGIKIAGRNIKYLRYADDTTLMVKYL